jgi:glycosyltransferase involved in cell wall biosynthesis
MKTVLILCEYGTLNGGERSMLATLPGISRAGYEILVTVPTSSWPLGHALRERGIEVVPFHWVDRQAPFGSNNHLPIDVRRDRLVVIIRNRRPALIHANSLSMGRLAGPVAADFGVPGISHIRDIVSTSRQYIADLNRNDRLLAVSEATRNFHVAKGVDSNRINVLYNGVDTAQFRPVLPTGYLHDDLGLPREFLLLGTIGQIGLRKGLDTIPLVLSLLGHDMPIAWLLVGERFSTKDEVQYLEAQLRNLAKGAFAGKLFFLGNRDDVDRILPELTLLVHPARQEPLGRVLLEAAAAGLAIVATDVGGTREIFPAESDAAVLVPPDDPAGMARAISELLRDPARRVRLGANARRRIESHFTIERATAGLLRHYEQVLNA